MKISVLMITHNKSNFLDLSIPTIAESFDEEFEHEFIVLDNGSDDDTGDKLNTYSEKYGILVARSEENLGLNGYRELQNISSGDIIVTVDDDVIWVSRYWERIFSTILNSTFDGKQFAYVGASTVNKDGGMMDTVWGVASIAGLDIDIAPVGGWFAAGRRDVIERIGGFHTGKALFHLEDADIQRRAWNIGYLCGICRAVNVYHARGEEYFRALGHEASYSERVNILKQSDIKM